MKLAISALAAIAALAIAAPAQARPLHDCSSVSGLGTGTLTTRGVQCSYARDTINRVFRASAPWHTRFGTQHMRVTGVVGWQITETHHFDCTIRRARITRANASVRLSIDCHDFGGAIRPGVALIRYSELFDAS